MRAAKKILIVFGTRPEAIKMVPLIKELQKHPDEFRPLVCVTAQHREMLDQVLHIFGVAPDYDLNVMHPRQDLYDVTSRILLGMREVLEEVKPDMMLVHGDTTTSMAAALAAFYSRVPVGHVEAGLRTFNPLSPWPEEMNRQLTGRIASVHFAPTATSRDNLIGENVPPDNIVVTGNTVIDTLLDVVERLNSDSALRKKVEAEVCSAGYDTSRLSGSRRLVLITGHRRENFGEGFISICKAIDSLAESFPDVDFVYPMHLNPNVRESIAKVFGPDPGGRGNLFFIEPLQYLGFVFLMSKCHLVLTDSGGIQEEAPGLGKPVLVMRDTTERPEAVEAGTVKLVGTDRRVIEEEVSRLLTDKEAYRQMSQAVNPYGDGKAAIRIAEKLKGNLFTTQ